MDNTSVLSLEPMSGLKPLLDSDLVINMDPVVLVNGILDCYKNYRMPYLCNIEN